MKRIVAVLLAVVTLGALFVVPASARGLTLSIPSTVSSHNLEAYGLHTMDVYETLVPPTIDGKIGQGEYPGPNNGCSLSSVPGDNLWMSAYHTSATQDEQQETYYGRYDFTDYVLKEDIPEYINSYLTYDDEFFYYGVTTTINAIRNTSSTDGESVYNGKTRRAGTWFVDAFVNFMQTDNVAMAHYNSMARTRFNLYKYDYYNTALNCILNETGYRMLTLIDSTNKQHYLRSYLPHWTDEETGITWNPTTYKRPENFFYQVTVLDNGKWAITFEGRFALGDILRITDVEYEDGTPIDYVPEWGVWGFNMRLQSSGNISSTCPDGSEVKLFRDDVIFAQTMLPAYGAARTQANSTVSGYLFHNTVSSAVSSSFGMGLYYLANPVHFLGLYDETFDYNGQYSQTTNTVAKTTTRVTRTRSPLTSGVRGVNYRVIGVATSSAGATGDSIALTVALSVIMLVCASAVVTVLLMKKRSHRA